MLGDGRDIVAKYWYEVLPQDCLFPRAFRGFPGAWPVQERENDKSLHASPVLITARSISKCLAERVVTGHHPERSSVRTP